MFPGADAQVEAAFLRFCQSLGIDTTGTKQEILTRILAHWVDDAKRRAKAMRLRELEAGQAAANQTAAEADTPL